MPVTRSNSGRVPIKNTPPPPSEEQNRPPTAPEEQQLKIPKPSEQQSESAGQSSGTTTTATETTTTEGTSGTERTATTGETSGTETTTTTEGASATNTAQSTLQPSVLAGKQQSLPQQSTVPTGSQHFPLPPAPQQLQQSNPPKSTHSKKSRRARLIAQEKEKLLRLQMELSKTRIAALEAESSEEDDAATVLTEKEAEKSKRIDAWLNDSQPHMLAITEAPYVQREPQLPSLANQSPIVQSRLPLPIEASPAAIQALLPPPIQTSSADVQALPPPLPIQTASAPMYYQQPPPLHTTTAMHYQPPPPVAQALPTDALPPPVQTSAAMYYQSTPPPIQDSAAVQALPLPPTVQATPAVMYQQPSSTPAATYQPLQPAGAFTSTVQPPTEIATLTSAITNAIKAGQQNGSRYTTDLPQFNGAHQDWLSFRAAYNESSISFNETENVARLRRSLKGRAREAVESLLITNAHAEDIIKMLETRFGRPDSIAMAELDRLRTLPRLSDTPRDLCVFASRVGNIVATLKALDRVYYLFNPEITKITVEKLTPTLRYRWFEFAAAQPHDEADLIKLSRFLQREADFASPYAQPEFVSSHQDNSTLAPRRSQRTYTATATPANTTSSNKCPVCNEIGHTTTQCPKFKDASSDDRWDMAKSNKLCFRCLRHRNKTHRCRAKKCNMDDCKYFHHSLLHFVRKPEDPQQKQKDDKQKTETVASTWTAKNTQAYLKIARVKVSGPAGEVDTFALLDDGSTVTLVDSSLAEQVGATGPIEPLHIEAIGDTTVAASKSRRVPLTLHGETQSHRIKARTIENLQLSTQGVTDRDIAGCTHLQDIQNSIKYDRVQPKILIGQDNWHLLTGSQMRKGQPHQPIASLTPLGWVLHGAHTRSLGQRVNYVNHLTTSEDRMEDQLKHYFSLEALTITPNRPRTDPEERALTILRENTTQTEEGHYQVALLWKNEDTQMPNNYECALKRLINIEKKIDRDPQLKVKYNQQMDALLQKGYAEQAPPTENKKKTWYLPHFGVVNPMKPDKLRIVHDAAARTGGVSLNDRLLTGPDLLQSLPGVIMRFRQHPIAVTADIAEMFMQVKVRPEDRDALRYLWRGNERKDKPTEYRMTSLIFGATCSPSTAIYVKDVNAAKFEETQPKAVAAIVNNHYVDDYLDSFKTEDEAIQTATAVRDIHRSAHYHLRHWVSNSLHVASSLEEDTSTKQTTVNLTDDTKTERVLGLIWKPDSDELAFNLDLARLPSDALNTTTPTKRHVLRVMMSLYDPLGLASPVTCKAKQLMQEVWRRGTGWDTAIDEDLSDQWAEWLKQLRKLQKVTIPRCYLGYSDAISLELHVFTDASEAAYAAALYWRTVAPNGDVKISLVLAKSKVAPLKLTSIPRLELQAAVMGSRIAATVKQEHSRKPDSTTFWTDSKTVLTWLKTGSRSYRPFVAHRIAAIEEHSTVKEWRWVPTKLNVADDATRGVPSDFDENHRWYKGPEFLLANPSTWPATESPAEHGHTGEEKTNHISEKKKTSGLQHSVPDSARFSKYEKLLRATARVLQFIKLCRPEKHSVNYKRTKKNKQADPDWKQSRRRPEPTPKQVPQKEKVKSNKYIPIDVDTLREAEVLLVRVSQEESFATEIEGLKNHKTVPNSSPLHPLAINLIDGIIKLRPRIGAARDITDIQKTPAVLHGDQRITRLWIEYTHRQLLHAGAETTLNECRQHYWIIRLRPTVRMIIHRCLPCRIRKNTPSQPATGNHPPARLAHHHRPFTYTGLDYFGPLTVTVGRTLQKRYVAIFTCLTTRAIHLELAASLSTDSAIMALRRMVARRGCPTEIWSDNGTNLHGADRELRRSINEATEQEASKKMIRWRYICPGAPFMGGAWERMVRAVKNALYAALHERHPTEEVLTTLLSEAEYTVNSRPLTHVSVDPEDLEAITPNSFLLGGSARVPVPGTFSDQDLVGRNHWRTSQRLADLFWSRWMKEYLPDLQYRREPHGRGPPLKQGDVVLIADSTLPRNTWPRGRVVATYPGADGVVRAADIQTKGGILRRATKKLVILPTEAVVPSQKHEECNAPEDDARRE